MINVIVCSAKQEAYAIHRKHIAESIGCDYEYIRIDNSDNTYGLCAAYNSGVKKASGDILVFCHEDLFPITPTWGKILENKFSSDETIGLIGVAGTQYLHENNPFWCAAGRPFIKGRVVHNNKDDNGCILTVFSEEEIDSEVVAVDGLFFAVRKELFDSVRFDEESFDKFHFYDLDLCMQVRKTHKIVVTPDILVKHLSGGSFKEAWKTYGETFIAKYKKELPVSCAAQKPDTEKRQPFDSFPLESILSPQTVDHIQNIGIELLDQGKIETDNKNQSGDIIVITGMHRSGTSAIAGLLSRCGFSLGPQEDLIEENKPKADNKKGLFENIKMVLINDSILKAAGGSWCNLPSQDQINIKSKAVNDFITDFDNTFEGTIVKDPRLCLTLNLWKKYCPRLKYALICFRHPLSVARSLSKRNNIPIESGLQLWYDYNTRLIDNIEHIPTAIINYDNLINHLEDDLFEIIRILHSSLSHDDMCKNINGFFENELNHNQIQNTDMESLPEKVQKLYQILIQNSISNRMGSQPIC